MPVTRAEIVASLREAHYLAPEGIPTRWFGYYYHQALTAAAGDLSEAAAAERRPLTEFEQAVLRERDRVVTALRSNQAFRQQQAAMHDAAITAINV